MKEAKKQPKPPPPFVCKEPIVFEVVKGNQSCIVTIDQKHARSVIPLFGGYFELLAGGGRLRLKP